MSVSRPPPPLLQANTWKPGPGTPLPQLIDATAGTGSEVSLMKRPDEVNSKVRTEPRGPACCPRTGSPPQPSRHPAQVRGMRPRRERTPLAPIALVRADNSDGGRQSCGSSPQA